MAKLRADTYLSRISGLVICIIASLLTMRYSFGIVFLAAALILFAALAFYWYFRRRLSELTEKPSKRVLTIYQIINIVATVFMGFVVVWITIRGFIVMNFEEGLPGKIIALVLMLALSFLFGYLMTLFGKEYANRDYE